MKLKFLYHDTAKWPKVFKLYTKYLSFLVNRWLSIFLLVRYVLACLHDRKNWGKLQRNLRALDLSRNAVTWVDNALHNMTHARWQPKFPEIAVQNSVNRFGPTRKVSNKQVHVLRWTAFPGQTGRNFGSMRFFHSIFFCRKKMPSLIGSGRGGGVLIPHSRPLIPYVIICFLQSYVLMALVRR